MRARIAAFLALVSLIVTAGRVAAQAVGIEAPRQVSVQSVPDSALVNALTNFQLLGNREFLREAGLAVRILAVPGVSGSAQDSGSDRVVEWLYIAVSDYGEMPEQHLYRLGPVYAPHLDSLVVSHRTPVAFVTYGARARRQRARIEIRLDGIRITDVRVGSSPPSG